MTTQLNELNESFGFEAQKTKNKWRVKVIESGWGSSGYYASNVLAQYGPAVFKKGTKVFMNHPSMTESNDRPERDVHQLAGKLVSDAFFDETTNSLFADIQFYSHYAPIIEEMYEDVGLSIHALGNAYLGEAEGREGPIVESLVADPLTSVDVVTVAGAGGKFISLLESYRSKGDAAYEVAESLTEGKGMSITKEEFEAAFTDLKTTLVEALSPLRESISVLVEAANPAEDEAGEEQDETPAIDPVEVAEKFNESGLPKIALQRVAEAMKSELNTKNIDELLTDERAYADSLREATKPAEQFAETGAVHEAGKASSTNDEFDAIVTRIAKK